MTSRRLIVMLLGFIVAGALMLEITYALYVFSNGRVLPVESTSATSTPQIEQARIPTHDSMPQRLIIKALGIDAPIEHLGQNAVGEMDTPDDWGTLAWYKPGYKPGDKGNAVIAGHYDNNFGLPAVFFRLKKLKAGDEIVVIEDDGSQLTFSVTHTATYDSSAGNYEVFGTSSVPRLNLITCNGWWSETAHNYSKRLVVFSELMEEKI
ncbi:MAG TPA: class F sortase [Candidatus Paceibacterota bacterium]